MDEIYEIGHSDANLSLLQQPCMVNVLFRSLFHMLSLWFTQMLHYSSNIGYRPTFAFLSKDFGPSDFSSSLARIDHGRTPPALHGRKSNKLKILAISFS